MKLDNDSDMETKKLDPLSSLVIDYQINPTSKKLKEICRLSHNLIYAVFRYYDIIKSFPSIILEEIEEECRTFILLRCIDSYVPNKNAKFSTFYTWRLKSRIRSQKHFYLRRMKLLQTVDIGSAVGGSDGYNSSTSKKLEEVLTKFDNRILTKFKKEMGDIFCI